MKNFKSFFAENRDKIMKIAESNAKYNEAGLATISKDDEWFYDDVWEKDLREDILRIFSKKLLFFN